MKRISSWFRSGKSSPDRRAPVAAELLADLEAQAEAAAFGFRWVPLNRAGDLCERAGDRARALQYYGRAIDMMLEDGQPEPARGLATKIVRIHPTAVRTLCTLTWLDLASHHMASVVVHLTEYVESAKAGGVEDLAGEQIYMMAQVVEDSEFRGAAAEALDALDRSDDAAEVTDWAAAGQAPHDGESPADWTDLCLSHALGSNVRKVDGQEATPDSGRPASSGANGEDASEGGPGRVEEVLAKRDQVPEGQDVSEEYRT